MEKLKKNLSREACKSFLENLGKLRQAFQRSLGSLGKLSRETWEA